MILAKLHQPFLQSAGLIPASSWPVAIPWLYHHNQRSCHADRLQPAAAERLSTKTHYTATPLHAGQHKAKPSLDAALAGVPAHPQQQPCTPPGTTVDSPAHRDSPTQARPPQRHSRGSCGDSRDAAQLLPAEQHHPAAPDAAPASASPPAVQSAWARTPAPQHAAQPTHSPVAQAGAAALPPQPRPSGVQAAAAASWRGGAQGATPGEPPSMQEPPVRPHQPELTKAAARPAAWFRQVELPLTAQQYCD